jgi:hypothetical protein
LEHFGLSSFSSRHIASRFASALVLPLHAALVVTTAKSFRDNPVLGSRVLNRLGLHAARYVAAHAITRLRRLTLTWLIPRELRRSFAVEGYVIVPDFLSPHEFAALQSELQGLSGEARACVQGDTATVMKLLDGQARRELPACRSAVEKRAFVRAAMYCGAKLRPPISFVHCVRNHAVTGGADPQRTFHSDTFHPAMKAWLFVEDVDARNGPFTYVPGSHRLTWTRLKWEYAQSLAASGAENRYASRGSLRIEERQLAELGFATPVSFAVRANTLVIADTHGFHRRGEASKRSRRLALYASLRANPFNPLPGFGGLLWQRLESTGLKLSWAIADRAAARRGVRASWHAVPASHLTAEEGAEVVT